jgi:hypothetical protein
MAALASCSSAARVLFAGILLAACVGLTDSYRAVRIQGTVFRGGPNPLQNPLEGAQVTLAWGTWELGDEGSVKTTTDATGAYSLQHTFVHQAGCYNFRVYAVATGFGGSRVGDGAVRCTEEVQVFHFTEGSEKPPVLIVDHLVGMPKWPAPCGLRQRRSRGRSWRPSVAWRRLKSTGRQATPQVSLVVTTTPNIGLDPSRPPDLRCASHSQRRPRRSSRGRSADAGRDNGR